MKKIFGKKPQATKPTPLPPPADAAMVAKAPSNTTKSLPTIPQPGKRSMSEVSPTSQTHSQAKLTASRPSFQQQPPTTTRLPPSRSTSGDDTELERQKQQPQHRDSAWVVVDSQPQSQSQSTNGSVGTPADYARPPAFESRSSLASLPPGASPPLPYPDHPPSSPFAQQLPPPPPPPPGSQSPATAGRRSITSRRLSDANGGVTPRNPYPVPNGGPMSASAENLYEASEISERDSKDKPEKNWKGLFNWADRDKAREKTQNHAALYTSAPDPNGPRWDITRTVGELGSRTSRK